MIYIDGVRYNTSASTGHRYITEVRYSYILNSIGVYTYSRASMVNYIKNHPNCVKTKYLGHTGYWLEGEDVRVVDNYYLRTDANNIKADNLGDLPEY